MGRCDCHPEIETQFICMKYNVFLCQECLTCRDPHIYCKYRSACPIWFMTRRAEGWELEERPSKRVNVLFQPGDKTAAMDPGSTLLEAANAAGVHLNTSCNGKGSCGKCKLVVPEGRVDSVPTPLLTDSEKAKGYVLACQSKLVQDVTVRIPEETLERRLKIAGMGQAATAKLEGLVQTIDPMLQEIGLELTPPSLADAVSDLDRLNRALKKQGLDVARLNVGLPVLRQLTAAVRGDGWKVTAAVVHRKCANELLEVRSGSAALPSLGLAIDVGTTSIVVYLVNMADGKVLAAASDHNRQAACGDDVINRIMCAEKDGVKKLSRMALATINALVGETLESAGAETVHVKNVVVAGNTIMTHLLLKIEPRYIRREPYIPTVSEFPIFKAGDIGLKANPYAAVFVMPGPASYVGGDIVSGLLFAGFHRREAVSLFIDVGTNGEIVVGNNEWLITAACSAGPAFEGGGIRWGMRAEEGAIEQVLIDPSTLEPHVTTIGGPPPRGICGSAMIDLICELLKAGIVDRSGRFYPAENHPRIQHVNGEWSYILVFAEHTAMHEDLLFTESDLKNLIYSKGAVYAGFTTLLREVGLDFSMIAQVIIAGGFGQYINIDKAVAIGLLPDIAREKFVYLGNSSIVGAYMALLSESFRREAADICTRMTYIDFSSNPHYMDEFTSALFLPHTNLEMFPSQAVAI
jgi:uncharacterized 2Fe-2S/4Fe-4S cluster protein (DUF4445 family)